jgi:hypothetical protein
VDLAREGRLLGRSAMNAPRSERGVIGFAEKVFTFPRAQWKTLRTTNTIERLHEECRRRVRTQGSLPSEDAAIVLLFSLVASGQIRLRRIDGWPKIATVLRQHTPAA